MRTCARLATALSAALFVASNALAEGPRPWRESPAARDPAGVFDYYLLSLSWSPSYCAASGARGDRQCARRFAFVLHGLWPQFERGWPQDCQSPDRGYVPYRVAEDMRDIMPSDRLVSHLPQARHLLRTGRRWLLCPGAPPL